MHDDPYPSRYYPRLERDPLAQVAVADFHHHESAWRSHSARLLLFLVAFYLIMALLFLASGSSHAASPQAGPAAAATESGCPMEQLALH